MNKLYFIRYILKMVCFLNRKNFVNNIYPISACNVIGSIIVCSSIEPFFGEKSDIFLF